MKQYSHGLIPSTPDFRDIPYSRLIGTRIGSSIKQRPDFHVLPTYPALDQNGINACLWYSFCLDAIRRSELEYGFAPVFNPIYGYVDRLPHHDTSDIGVQMREALEVYQKRGMAEWSYFPYYGTFAQLNPRIQSGEIDIERARENAYIHRIGTYARLWGEDEIKDALLDGYYVIIAFPVYRHYTSANGKSILPDIPKDKLGSFSYYHANIQYGYQPYGRFIQNSWSDLWGNEGRVVIPYSYPIIEAWAVTDIPVPDVERLWDCILEPNNPKAFVFGNLRDLPVAPENKGGRTFVPLRFISEQLGYKVHWTAHDEPITIEKGDRAITVKIGDYFFWREDKTGGKMDARPYLLDDGKGFAHVMVPIRFIAEGLGGEVHWSNKDGKVYIRK